MVVADCKHSVMVNMCEGDERQYRKFHKPDNGAEEML